MNALDTHDILPSGMREYISNYGFHFSKKACDFAVSLMRDSKGERISTTTKEAVDDFLRRFRIDLERKHGYDYVFVYHMAVADYFKSSISDEQHLAMFVKDYIDDEDASEETPFRRWLATMVGNGIGIDWEDII